MSTQAGEDWRLRRMTVADIDDVMAIERASFASPWSRQFFLDELRADCANSVLCQVHGKPVGYVVYWELPDEVDVHNVAVHPQHRRRGVGRAMLGYVMDEGTRKGLRRMTLEVRKSNDAAQALYRSLGFEVCGLRKGYYSDNAEDAWVMERRLRESRPELS